MQKVNFLIYDQLGDQIDEVIEKWGYSGRAEFFRALAIEFLQKQAQLLPPKEVIEEYIKAIRMVKSNQQKQCFWPEKKLPF